MRAGAKPPAHLWKEIYQAAVYLYNKTPKYMYRWTTPYLARDVTFNQDVMFDGNLNKLKDDALHTRIG